MWDKQYDCICVITFCVLQFFCILCPGIVLGQYVAILTTVIAALFVYAYHRIELKFSALQDDDGTEKSPFLHMMCGFGMIFLFGTFLLWQTPLVFGII